MATTIQMEESTKRALERVKLFPRETYNQIVERLLQRELEEEEAVLSPKAVKNIEQAIEDVKAGRLYSTKEAKKRLGIKWSTK